MPAMSFSAVTYAGNGVLVTVGTAVNTIAVPTTADGRKARFVFLQALPNAYAYVRPSATTPGTAAAGDLIVTPNEARILNVAAHDYLAFIADAAGQKLVVCPIEF